LKEQDEKDRAKLYYKNLGEAIASCGGAIQETMESGMFKAKDYERLQAARMLLAIVRENMGKRYSFPPVTPKWMMHVGFYMPAPLPAGLMVRDRTVFDRRGS